MSETESAQSPERERTQPSQGGDSLKEKMKREPNPAKRLFQLLGPGFITGASDDDPSGIGTYAVAGAVTGYATLWTALLTFPLMAAVQYISAKIGLVSGRGLADVIRKHYSRRLLYPVVVALVIANTINAGVDIGAIAAGINLLVPIPIAALVVPIALLIVALQIWGSYRTIANIFKWLTLSLLAYIGSAFFAKPAWAEVLKGTFLPTLQFDSKFLATLVAILGTTISPYLFFWQASQEVEEERKIGRRTVTQREGATDDELRSSRTDVLTGMFFSNLVMYFIMLATAATLHESNQTEIGSAAEAAEALRPLAGPAAYVLMALALIGSGFLAVPILTTSGAYALCEAFRWKWGLDKRPGSAKEFYVIIAVSTLVGLGVNFVGFNPVDALFWTAVINGFLAPPVLVILMRIANNRAVMGERVNSLGINLLGWTATAAMFAAAIGLVLTWGNS